MTDLLVKLFVKDNENTQSSKVRQNYGIVAGSVGICCNALLVIMKMIVGIISGSVSIIADALNNLSDAASSVVTLLGYKLSSMPSDDKHPFGHGRIEYISGFIVSMVIIFMGFEMATTSIKRIINPEQVEFSYLSIIVLVVAILVKLWMYFFNIKLSKKISSATLKATAFDSLSDVFATLMVVVGVVVYICLGINIDGYAGLLVALFIFYAGFMTAKDTFSLLLGETPDPELVQSIEKEVLSYDNILGVHDLIVHSYGAGNTIISLHAEVPENGGFLEMHDLIDNIERDLKLEFQCEASIHMDPIVVDDEEINALHVKVAKIVRELDEHMTIHDFRFVKGPTHSNLIFDIVVPHRFKYTDAEIKQMVLHRVREIDESYNIVATIDKSYV